MTDLQRAENAHILNSLWNMGETAFDSMLQPIIEMVEQTERRQQKLEGPTVEEREPCPDCFDTGEMVTRGYDGSNPDVEICPCRKVK